jgi:Na+-driven multidrug efflux pump
MVILAKPIVVRSLLQFVAVAITCVFLAGVANAVPIAGPTKPAPAPLLAAGIPAFLALGGGALIGRFKRRRKSDRQPE